MAKSDDVWSIDEFEEPEPSFPRFDTDGPRRPCPMCGELISQSARSCPSCGERFGRGDDEPLSGTQLTDLSRFRREMRGLAGFWIFFGGINLVLGLFLVFGGSMDQVVQVDQDGRVIVGLFCMIIGGIWLASGIGSACKQTAWVVAGLVVNYGVIALNLINLQAQSVCSLILVILATVQAHRVLNMASRLRMNDVDLTRKR